MRVATWDVDHRRTSGLRRVRQGRVLAQAAADVVVLTGAATSLVPAGHDVVTTTADDGGVHDVVLTARRLQPVAVPELTSAVAAVVDGPRLVVGVRLAPEEHDLRSLDRVLTRLRDHGPDLPLVLAGGFGQTLQGHVVGGRVGRALLAGLLHRHGLAAHTASAPSARAGCASVDHVCSAPPLVAVETWSSVDTEAGLLLTDHLGYAVDL